MVEKKKNLPIRIFEKRENVDDRLTEGVGEILLNGY